MFFFLPPPPPLPLPPLLAPVPHFAPPQLFPPLRRQHIKSLLQNHATFLSLGPSPSSLLLGILKIASFSFATSPWSPKTASSPTPTKLPAQYLRCCSARTPLLSFPPFGGKCWGLFGTSQVNCLFLESRHLSLPLPHSFLSQLYPREFRERKSQKERGKKKKLDKEREFR